MNVKKAIKSIAAVAVGAAMVGSTVLGAADLANYPSNMITDGAFNGKIVIGLNAKPQDVIAAIDIATSLQASSVKQTAVATGSSKAGTYTVSGGVSLKKDNSVLSPIISSLFASKASLDDQDLKFLEDGTLSNEDTNKDVKYSQTLAFDNTAGRFRARFDKQNSDFDDPTLYLDTPDFNMWTYTVDFDETVNMTKFKNNEVLTLMGQEFYVSPDQDTQYSAVSNLKLTKAAQEATVGVGEDVTLSGHKISLVGSTDAGKITITIDGTTKSAEEGDTISVGGVNFFIKDVFVQSIPTDHAVAVVSVGSDELLLDFKNNEIKLNDEKVDGYTVTRTGLWTQALEGFSISFNPYDADTEYVLKGESIKDPIFGLEVKFGGLTQELDDSSKTPIDFENSGSEFKVKFTNVEGKELSFTYLKSVTGDGTAEVYDKLTLVSATGAVLDDKYFFLNEDEQGAADVTTQFYTDDVSSKDNAAYITLKDMTKKESLELKSGKELYDTGAYVLGTADAYTFASAPATSIPKDTVFLINQPLPTNTVANGATVAAGDYIWESAEGNMLPFTVLGNGSVTTAVGANTAPAAANLFGASTVAVSGARAITISSGKVYAMTGASAKPVTNLLWTAGGARITLDASVVAAGVDVVIDEDPEGNYVDKFSISAPDNREQFTVSIDEEGSSPWEPKLTTVAATNAKGSYGIADENGDWQYGLSAYGTYYKFDVDGDRDTLNIWYPGVEQNVIASVGMDQTVSTSGSSAAGTVTTTTVNPIPVGVAISDEDAMGLIGKSNLIVVGGPVVNTVMAKLKGNPSSEAIAAEYKPGVGLVELYDKANFAELGTKVALLVSGYEWQDTQRAARAVAQHSDKNFKGSAIEVHGTSTTISEIKAVSE